MKIIEALNIKEPTLITLIGGGGKTTTLFRLGEELRCLDERVVISTTTAIFMPDPSTYDIRIITKSVDEAKRKINKNPNAKSILLGKEITPENKLKGFTPYEMDEIYRENKDRWFLVEGDGSNGRSLKIPAKHEPQVPSSSCVTIILIGADIFGKEINEKNVHRHHLLNELIHKYGDNVDKNLVLDLIFHPLGITKGIPNSSKKVILFNKARSSKSNGYDYFSLFNLSREILQTSKEKCPSCILSKEHGFTYIDNGIFSILLGEVQDEDPILEVLGGTI